MDGFQKQYKKPQKAHSVRSQMNAGVMEMELGEKVESKKGKTKKADIPRESHDSQYQVSHDSQNLNPSFFRNVQDFDVNDVPRNAFILCIASRRSGKTTLITHFLETYTKTHKTDGVFLFTKTNAAFDGIPKPYRFKDLAILEDLVETQVRVKKHNESAKEKDKVSSNIVIVLDDMLSGTTMKSEMRRNPLLNKLSTLGRHLSSGEHSNMMIILISQVFTAISPQIRLNTDFLFTTKLAARRERENIVNSFLALRSGRKGLAESYEVFDTIVNSSDFNFIAVHTTKQNKKTYLDYVYNFKAPAKLKNCKLCGDSEDWKNNKKEVYW